jgi:hypothetical protein
MAKKNKGVGVYLKRGVGGQTISGENRGRDRVYMEGDGVTRWISGWVGVVGGGVWCEARGMRGRGGGARQGGEGGCS